eukprot:c40945_g1_i1.p3 GENE.c40945_g1_i1~~c40945_g1_i1.p3  ORF type:complete len:109 (-),score=20.27 c40945_g1_i1:44-370(-)
MASLGSIVNEFLGEYNKTPQRLRIVDAFAFCMAMTAVIQLSYCVLVGTFPFNSFLAGFFSSVGTFILTICLRVQVNPANGLKISAERAFADYVFCNIVLHLVVVNFLG